MREASQSIAVLVCLCLMIAVAGCTTNANTNAGQRGNDTPNPNPAPGNDDPADPGGSPNEPGDDNEDDGMPSAMDVLTASEQNALQNATEAANGLTNVAGTNRAGAGFPDTGPAQYSEPSDGCPSVLAVLEGDDEQFIFSLDIDYGNGCTPLWDPDATCSGRAVGTLSLFEQRAETNFEAFSCGESSINGDAAVNYDWTGTAWSSKGNWNLQFTDENGNSSTTGVGTTEYDLVNELVTVVFFDGSVTDDDENWNVTLEDVVVSSTNCGCKIPEQGTVTLSGSEIRTLIIRFNADTPNTGEIEVSIDGEPFFTVTIRDLFNLVDPDETEENANGDGTNDGGTNDGETNNGETNDGETNSGG
jgi:hypothetical protein